MVSIIAAKLVTTVAKSVTVPSFLFPYFFNLELVSEKPLITGITQI